MGVLSVTAKNAAVQAAADLITHAGVLGVTVITGTVGEADNETFTKVAHGMVNGDIVLLTAMTGGTGLTAGTASNADGGAKVYFVVNKADDTFQLSETLSGTAATFSADVSAVTVNKLTEVTGGDPAYARKAVSKNAAASGSVTLSATIPFDIPASTVVGGIAYCSAITDGTMHGIDGVVFETFAAQGVYTVTAGSIASFDTAS